MDMTYPDASAEPDSDSGAAWRRLGAVREAAGDLAGALTAYDQALRRSPDEIGLLSVLGRLALRM